MKARPALCCAAALLVSAGWHERDRRARGQARGERQQSQGAWLTPEEQAEAAAVAYSEDRRGTRAEYGTIISVIANRARSGDRDYVAPGQTVNAKNVMESGQFQGFDNEAYRSYLRGQKSAGFAVNCFDNLLLAGDRGGIVRAGLRTGQMKWRALMHRDVYEGPVSAGGALAFVSNASNTIYGLSGETGELLWKRDHKANQLGADGRYFYAPEYDTRKVVALEPGSGKEAWSAGLWTPAGWRYLWIFAVKGRRLYTQWQVIDLDEHKVIQCWPRNRWLRSIGFLDGDVVFGDDYGQVTEYDPEFHVLRHLTVGNGQVASVAGAKEGVLVLFKPHREPSREMIEFLAWDGHVKWMIPGAPPDAPLSDEFTVVGDDVLLTELRSTSFPFDRWGLGSRSLETGKVNWAAPEGNYDGAPAICGEMAYMEDGEAIRRFDIKTGRSLGQVYPEPERRAARPH